MLEYIFEDEIKFNMRKEREEKKFIKKLSIYDYMIIYLFGNVNSMFIEPLSLLPLSLL